MDDFSENKSAENEETSTIFSAPAEHKEGKTASPKKKRIITVIASIMAVMVLVGGTLAVIKFIPEMKEEDNSSNVNSITVIDFDKSEYDTLTVKNQNGEFVFLPKTDSESNGLKWYLKDLAEDKISASKTDNIISSASSISASFEITKKTYDECGFNSPIAEVTVKSKELGDFFLLLGDKSPDNFGRYLYCSVDEKIYLVSENVADSFVFTALDLASTDAVSPISVNTENEKYVNENGTLISFDKLVISGSRFKQPITIVPNDQDVGFTYKTLSPISRYADDTKVSSLFGAFSSGISVSGVYSFDTDTVAQKQLGLDNADMVLEITVGGESFTYRFTLQDDGFYALFGNGMNTIKKVSSSSAEFLSLDETGVYNKLVYIRNISELKNMTFDFEGTSYSFDISENSEDNEEKYTVYYGKKLIKSENFQNFYMQFVSMSLVNFSAGNLKQADLTVKITDNSGAVETLSFEKASATEYYCFTDGKPLGKITSATYNKLVNNIKTVSQNKNVEN